MSNNESLSSTDSASPSMSGDHYTEGTVTNVPKRWKYYNWKELSCNMMMVIHIFYTHLSYMDFEV